MSRATPVPKPPPKIYNPSDYAALMVMEKEPHYMILCPKCDKRTLDVSEMPERMIKIRYKCPHCKNVVIVPLTATEAEPLASDEKGGITSDNIFAYGLYCP